ncbi:MAG: hypothetical protein JXQ71_14610, partial [Verrucomicrobia bacterium]|nr:hypothetical protein [Verrucomicrobiota bacterium]
MSSQQPDNIFDLEQHFLPAWAKQSPAENRFANYEGEPERRGGRDRDRDRRRERRDRPPPRRDQAQDRGPGGAPYPRRRDGRGREDWRRDDGGRPRFERADRPPPPPPEPLPDLNLAFVPDDKGVESLARQIKATGRAYPLFDIAQMILAKPERHHVTFSVVKNAEGVVANPMYLCALDETLWLSEAAAMQHLLDRHFTTFYQPERTQVEAPKGTYTFVAQCGMSGVILGPPNHHDYQNQLRKLHAERFSRMPFDVFKSRVKIVREEAVVKKWIEDQSYKTHYVCLNMPEPLTLHCREEVESHFRETHLPNLVQSVETHRMSGTASRNLHESALRRLVRQAWEDQRRFPIQVATVLSQQFAASGLQFFKVNRTVTHVAVARPHYLDLDITPVSESIRQIVNYINANPKCTHNQLLEALAPMPGADESTEPTPERTAVVADLHWLVHEGHVIEFANGVLETAKKPLPKPPPKTAPAAGTAAATTETDACAPAAAETAGAAAGASTAAAPPEPAPPAAATESASLAVSAEPTQPTDPP